jgi:hypothetical protein
MKLKLTISVLLLGCCLSSTLKAQQITSLDALKERIEQSKEATLLLDIGPIKLPEGINPGVILSGDLIMTPPDNVEITGVATIENLDLDLSFDLAFTGSTFDMANLTLENEVQIGESGLHLYSLDGSINSLSSQYPSINAISTVGIGPKMFYSPIFDEDFPMVFAKAETEIGTNGYFKIAGQGFLFGFEVANVSLEHNTNIHVQASGDISMYGGAIRGKGNMNYMTHKKTMSGGASLVIDAPLEWPLIGGLTFEERFFNGDFDISTGYVILNGGVELAMFNSKITYYNKPQNTIDLDIWGTRHIIQFAEPGNSNLPVTVPDFRSVDDIIKFHKSNYLEWEVPFIHMVKVPETGGLLVMNKNFNRLQRYSSINHSRVRKMGDDDRIPFKIGEKYHNSKLVFRLNYENDITESVKLQLKMPDGMVLEITEGLLPDGYLLEGQTDLFGFSAQNKGAREAYFTLSAAKSGEYEFIIDDNQKMGDFTVEVLRQNAKPSLGLVVASEAPNRDGTVRKGMFKIDWFEEESDVPDANIEFYLDSDNKIPNGIKAASKKRSEFEEDGVFTFPTDHLGVQPGWYYVYMLIDDGLNSPTIKYADQKIWVDMDEAPKPVEHFNCVAGDGELTINWIKPEDQGVYYFDIYYGKESEYQINDMQAISHLGENQRTITGLENGTPYLVSVMAVDEDGNTSGKRVIQRVVPRATPGASIPVILSTPKGNATITRQYYYQPNLFDRDTQTHLEMKVVADKSHKIHWELLQGPDGMTIDNETGFVSWTPVKGDLGNDVRVDLSVTKSGKYSIDNNGQAIDMSNPDQHTVQSFNIHVDMVPYGENDAGISSRPFLTAYPGKTYEYIVSYNDYVNTDEITIELLEGPINMNIEDNKLVWQVPDDATGEPVQLVAETLDGKRYTQDFFIHVESSEPTIDQKPEILAIQDKGEHFNIVFFGTSGKEYEVQIADLIGPDQTTWQAAGRYSSGGGITVHSHSSPAKKSQFFRVLQVAN